MIPIFDFRFLLQVSRQLHQFPGQPNNTATPPPAHFPGPCSPPTRRGLYVQLGMYRADIFRRDSSILAFPDHAPAIESPTYGPTSIEMEKNNGRDRPPYDSMSSQHASTSQSMTNKAIRIFPLSSLKCALKRSSSRAYAWGREVEDVWCEPEVM
ncbi:uncharacterized protein ARMOST_15235 [Armillaria ostoyae]|uniref:Uncharacterized protein n=1 Tax=Armillaria ostoyae TaxID=47428 RepID=A0A284RST2_ARMOS|nr:uncharacterized protein ARMOST_15235 [Armillaria ostoyae]